MEIETNMPVSPQLNYRGSFDSENPHLPILLIHGAGGSYLYWPPEIRHLPGDNLLAIDLPGHGDSRGNSKSNIDAYACALLEFLENLGINEVMLAGHSMGGAIALSMVLKDPGRVKGLVLLGSGAKLRVHPQLLEDCRSPETYPRVVSSVLEWSFSPETDRKLVNLAGERLKQLSPNILLGDFTACNAFDVRQQLSGIKLPTLILCGEEDQMTPPRFSAYLAEQIPNSKLEVIPGAGHMVMLEQPVAVARLIAEFRDARGENQS
jgi:pimeloyl-ACP methyl ester carboxylesterase